MPLKFVKICLFTILLSVLSRSSFAADQPKVTDPKETMKGVKVVTPFEVTLFAAPPNVGYPVCMCAAPTGELFVGIDENGSLDQKPNRGRVVRCIDTDGDGKADKFTTFCSIDSPRGIFFDDNELIVLHPPMIEAWYDDNGTGVANRHETLVSGLGFGLDARGADHTTNGIRMGIDGWIYIAMGDYGSPNAVAKDGSKLKHRGGGIVRVRPDGSDLEMYAIGTRNICDVAVDPYMNLFVLDNTNDGDGWWVRCAHIIQSGNYGYPMYYLNFIDELIPPMADYGGGAPTGALYIQEPGWPKDFGDALYFCEWGHGKILRTPLVPKGASFMTPHQTVKDRFTMLDITRPTGIDIDGQSKLYVASWKGATFNYAGPNAGFVVQVTDPKYKAPPFPDLKKASEADLLSYLASDSHVKRLHTSREILRRGAKPDLIEGLQSLAAKDGELAPRVAALYTLKQLLGIKAQPALLKLAAVDALREHALRALTDRKKELDGLDLKLFTDALSDKNPRVQMQALISLGRIGKIDAAEPMMKLAAGDDPIIAHIAINNLAEMKASDAAFKALDSGDTKQRNGAVRVLQAIHEPVVVDGLIKRIDQTGDPYQQQAVLKALCRLYNREGEWAGTIKTWWTTRPDSTGPYYQPETWEKSDAIGKALLKALQSSDGETKRWLVGEMPRNRIELPEIYTTIDKLAAEDPTFKAKAVAILVARKSLPASAVKLVADVARSPKEDSALRAKAIRGLIKSGPGDIAFECVALIEPGVKDLASVREEYIRDGRHNGNLKFFSTKAQSAPPAERELAFAVMLHVLDSHKNKTDKKEVAAKEAAEKALQPGWSDSPGSIALLHALSATNSDAFNAKVVELESSPDAAVAEAARAAAKKLRIKESADPKRVAIKTMKYEDVVIAAKKEKGDADLGEQLFKKSACIACHTVTKGDPPKGPYLGDIANRYPREELIESIVKPNAKIAQGFETQGFKMKDGSAIQAFVIRESSDTIDIKVDPQTEKTLQKADIAKRVPMPGISIMPTGIADDLTVKELASLLAYLEKLNEQNKK